MKNEFKYRARRLIVAIILLAIFMTFTVSVLVKGIDNEFDREEQAIEVLNDEYGEDNYRLDQWAVSEEEVFKKMFGGY